MISDYPKKGTFKKPLIEGLIFTLLALVFIVPQIFQQISQDLLPATGDLVHKRIVYFMTNFPNVYNEIMMSETGHSKLFHYGVSLFNILAGFMEAKSFYGFVVVSLIALISVLITILMIAKRLGIKYSFLNLLFFLSSPVLIFPFLGQANQYLIYLFLPLIVFILFFIPPKFKTHCALALLIGATLNSHFMIWLPLLLFAFAFEWLYPQFYTLVFLPLGVLLYWPFLAPPLIVLSGAFSSSLFIATLLGVFVFLMLHQLIKRKNNWARASILLTTAVAFFLFIYPQNYSDSLPKNLDDGVTAFQSLGFFSYFFGLGKNWVGDRFYAIFFTISSLLIVWLWFKHKSTIALFDQTRLKMIVLLALIPAGVAILKFVLLTINPFYFISSRLAQLHQLRLTVFTFFFLPFLVTYLLQYWQRPWQKITIMALSIVLILDIVGISQFFFLRTVENKSQMEYFQSLPVSVLDSRAYEYELAYHCYFLGKCNKLLESE